MASAAMASRHRAEKAQHDSDDAELERMIASMPVLFRERVRKQVLANRRQAARVANAIGGTNGSRVMKGVSASASASRHEGKKEDGSGVGGRPSSPLSLPVPVLTEVYHQGGFDKHIERQKEVRRRKAQLENKFRKFKWAPGHTITQPFSFEARCSNASAAAARANRTRRSNQPKSRISGYYGSLDLESARGMSSPGRKAVKKKKLRVKKKKQKKTAAGAVGAEAGAEKGMADTDTKTDDAVDADDAGKKRGQKMVKKKKKKKKKKKTTLGKKKKTTGGVKSRIDSFQSKKMMRLTHAKRRDYVHGRGTAGTTLDNKEHGNGAVASLGNVKQRAAATFR
jgi:hypothetical protein